MEFLKGVDPWFINMLAFVLALYFVWSIKGLFRDLRVSIDDLKKLIQDLYEHRNDHEHRITALETRCDIQHGSEFPTQRQGHGRRKTDRPLLED